MLPLLISKERCSGKLKACEQYFLNLTPGDALVRFHLNTTSTGKLYFYVDEKWSQVEQTSQCQNKLDLAQYSCKLTENDSSV